MSKKKRSRWRELKTAQPAPQQQNPARSVAEQGEPLMPRISSPAISAAKLTANIANAQLSTGAVTPEGKAVVSQNATRHGLTGKFRVLPNESQDDFDRLLAAFLRDEQPADQEEIEMVHFMAEATWLSRRSVRLQDQAIILIENGTPEERKEGYRNLALYLRYMTSHDRAYSRYAADLRKRRNERLKRDRGFVSQKYREAAELRREAAEHRRDANENRKKELHELRQQRVAINNRIAAAKAERLERQNTANSAPKLMAAAA
jgi:hypothetical protein